MYPVADVVEAFIGLSAHARSDADLLRKDSRLRFTCEYDEPSFRSFSASAGSLYLNMLVLPSRITQPGFAIRICL